MGWPFLILSAVSAAAGAALGPVIGRRARQFMLLGGVEAAALAVALTWLMNRGVALPLETVAGALALALLTTATVLLPFWLGATWTGP